MGINKLTNDKPKPPTPEMLREWIKLNPAGDRSNLPHVDILALADKMERLDRLSSELIRACYKVQDWEGTRVGDALVALEGALRER